MADQRGAAMIEYSILITIVAGCLLFSVTVVALWSQGKLDAFREAVGIASPMTAATASSSVAATTDSTSSTGAGDETATADPSRGSSGGFALTTTGKGNNGNGGANGSLGGGSTNGRGAGCVPCGRPHQ
jgi:Flp pilus assembly pilin Flp